METASFAIEPFLRKEDIINLSKIKTIPAQTSPAKKYKYGLSTNVEIAYVIENKPSVAGTSTSAPKPACLMCSERGHRARISSSEPTQKIKKRYSFDFKRYNFLCEKSFSILLHPIAWLLLILQKVTSFFRP